MDTLYRLTFVVGFVLIAVANLGKRSPSAPPIMGGDFRWPWQMRDRFVGSGFVMHVTGIALWALSVVVTVVHWLL